MAQEINNSVIIAGGCFWCLDAAYRQVNGVTDVISGYAGGETTNPTYEAVCSGRTGHAEAVMVVFDDSIRIKQDIFDIFWTIHDPTTLNRQGADIGTQYRSALFYRSDQEKELCTQAKSDAAEFFDAPLVTSIEPLDNFYVAEDYHQDYFAKNPGNGYCSVVISPKLSKLRRTFSAWLKT